MLRNQPMMSFLATRNADRAREFYGDVLGLTLLEDNPHALSFEANGTMLRVQKVDAFTPHAFTSAGWRVAQIDSIVDALAARGVLFERYAGLQQDARGVWLAPRGARVAWFRDPDGNVLSLTQFPDGA